MSEATDSVQEALVEAAIDGVQTVTVDGTTVTTHSLDARMRALKELIALDGNVAPAAQPHFGMRFTKLISPGAGG